MAIFHPQRKVSSQLYDRMEKPLNGDDRLPPSSRFGRQDNPAAARQITPKPVKSIKFEDSSRSTSPPSSGSRARTGSLPPQLYNEQAASSRTIKFEEPRSSAGASPCHRTRRASAAECTSFVSNANESRISREQLAKWKENLEEALSKDPSKRPTLFNRAFYAYNDLDEDEEEVGIERPPQQKSKPPPLPSRGRVAAGAVGPICSDDEDTPNPEHRDGGRSSSRAKSKGGKLSATTRHLLERLKRRGKGHQSKGLGSETECDGDSSGDQQGADVSDSGLEDAVYTPTKSQSENTVAGLPNVKTGSKWRMRLRGKSKSGFMFDPDLEDQKKQEMAYHFRNSVDEMVSKREIIKTKLKIGGRRSGGQAVSPTSTADVC